MGRIGHITTARWFAWKLWVVWISAIHPYGPGSDTSNPISSWAMYPEMSRTLLNFPVFGKHPVTSMYANISLTEDNYTSLSVPIYWWHSINTHWSLRTNHQALCTTNICWHSNGSHSLEIQRKYSYIPRYPHPFENFSENSRIFRVANLTGASNTACFSQWSVGLACERRASFWMSFELKALSVHEIYHLRYCCPPINNLRFNISYTFLSNRVQAFHSFTPMLPRCLR